MFLGTKSDEYKKNTNHKRMVIDFIAGMTDKMFDREVKLLAKNGEKWYNYALLRNGGYYVRLFI